MQDLSPEDETRRRKRRERNKVAAEKCRIKKKKATLNLFAESKVVEAANAGYKEEIARLETEEKHLLTILARHKPSCQLAAVSATGLDQISDSLYGLSYTGIYSHHFHSACAAV